MSILLFCSKIALVKADFFSLYPHKKTSCGMHYHICKAMCFIYLCINI